jgi:hypothetical protein
MELSISKEFCLLDVTPCSPSKRRLTLNGLHDVISWKIELFITTAVRTSNSQKKKKKNSISNFNNKNVKFQDCAEFSRIRACC